MVFDGILISIIIGFLRKGSLRGIAEIKLKGGYIFPLLLIIQLTIYLLQSKFALITNISGYLFITIYLCGMYFLWLNRKHCGFLLILAGVFLNFLVMAINGGRMPVSMEAAIILDPYYIDVLLNDVYGKHMLLTESTKLAFLGDIIPITNPYPKSQVISIGDIFMNIGIFFFIQQLMLKHKLTKISHPVLKKEVN
ncbi:hypothetical protein DS745_09290 [Anaerobacillus alkaliphilus]|uniref:DUF5317 domain-containing protein n=1 Tax=Anaerobacillus alkaliphilus TaxID=1548597 RepID=A0A4V1LGH3_9BACI|nr:DUF5317 domain-containing protein [Anaerobacillus alkaliphilus]RXJ01664.1 hypothetical protein DS745_09290 [Anaerobacillus alkaliphilus]